jgi:YD repeat-containing protein
VAGALHDGLRPLQLDLAAEAFGHGEVGTADQQETQLGSAHRLEELGVAAAGDIEIEGVGRPLHHVVVERAVRGEALEGQRASLTDANANTTAFAYDGLDRLSTTTFPGGSTEVLTYDADGNVLTRKTRAGPTIAYAWDTLNRLVARTPPSPWPAVTYSYDLAGRQTSVGDTGAAIAAAVPPGGSTVAYATTTTYDRLNRPTAVSFDPVPAAG